MAKVALLFTVLCLTACGSDSASGTQTEGNDFQYAPIDVEETEEVIEDVAQVEDTDEPGDVPLPFDVGAETDLTEADPDVKEKTPDSFTSCPTLGVSPYWEGTFEGVVTYNLKGDEPMQGLFLVGGNLP